MQYSLKTLLFSMLALGMVPLCYQNFLIPFFAILVICLGMSIHGFGQDYGEDD